MDKFYQKAAKISIHAPREGGDGTRGNDLRIVIISIHAPREGGDNSVFEQAPGIIQFQSTPPARGATEHLERILYYFKISIHAPREGGDCCHQP